MKLSIIVPVYNVADYLPKCLDSLLVQDLPQNEYEIIVVNDGSTDNSGNIAQQYADKYANITLINQANQGLSGARNTGINHAKGDYIQFVDSDDYLEENVLGGLMTQVEKDNLDVLRFKYQNVRINNESKEYEVFKPYKLDSFLFDNFSSSVTDGISFLNERFGTACYAVMFIIRKTILDNCIFKQGIYFEDTEWTPRMIIKAERIASSDAIVYNYLMREGSITKAINKDKQRKVVEDKIKLIDSLLEHSNGLEDKSWFERMIASTVLSLLTMISVKVNDEKSYVLDTLNKMNVYPLSTLHNSSSAIKKIKLINFSPKLFCFLVGFKNR